MDIAPVRSYTVGPDCIKFIVKVLTFHDIYIHVAVQ